MWQSLKAKAQTVIFTQVQYDDEDDKESVASSNYINNGAEEDIVQIYHITLIEDGEVEEEDAEDAPAELEEEPQNIHELRSLQGKPAYLWRLISNLASRCQPFSCLMKKDVPFQWDEACDKAFKSIKSYLMKPPVLVAPVPERPLILYVAAEERLMGWLGDVELEHLPRKDNKQADALAKLASTLSMTDKEARILVYVVGPLTKSSGGHLCILAATNYFSKWAEAVPLKEVKKENITDFIRTHIIYCYGVPRHIIADNGKHFCNSLIDKLCQKFGFKQRNFSIYYAAANGLAEAFNKTLCNLLKKVVAKSKRD
ncbi:UNVERIFIED_CONTAM: hypothetical protein Scaly_1157700 [Sesamum calycinum]|uniref:Integrase catalytic domain-containing protein n=1 Tax=Sesamum calycinum TaxID=2727403 RepID=A0AAW2Q368_9LAMI